MGQKINPVALRLLNRTFDASWYNDNFNTSFKTEQYIRNALVAFFHILSQTIPNQCLGRVFFQKSHKKTVVTFFFFKKNRLVFKKKNRFLFKFSDFNYQKSKKTKNYSSVLKTQYSQFLLNTVSENVNQSKLKVLTVKKNSKASHLIERLGHYMFMPSSIIKSHYLFPKLKSFEFSQIDVKKQDIHCFPDILEYKKLIRVTFYCLLYTAFLRKQNKCAKIIRNVEFRKGNIFLQYLFTFLKMPLYLLNNKVTYDTIERSEDDTIFALKANPDGYLFKKANDIVVHPFLRTFEHGLASFSSSNIYLRPILCRELNQSAIFIAEQIVQILQKNQKKKMPGRLIKKLLITDSASARGIRIMCSGRLAGAEMARKFFLKKGQTSLNVFSQKIDFAQKIVQTKYGIVGVKVWISF